VTANDGKRLKNNCPSKKPNLYPGTHRCFPKVWSGFACNYDPATDPAAHHRKDTPCKYKATDGKKMKNNCPSKMPILYPNTHRCFSKMWSGLACNYNPATDPAAHHRQDTPCEYDAVVELKWYTKPGSTSTYDQDVSFCASKSALPTAAAGRLATFKEYCPGDWGWVHDGKKTDDQWAAFSGAGLNQWVQVGSGLTCKTHIEQTGQAPSWGTEPDKNTWEKYILCALP